MTFAVYTIYIKHTYVLVFGGFEGYSTLSCIAYGNAALIDKRVIKLACNKHDVTEGRRV